MNMFAESFLRMKVHVTARLAGTIRAIRNARFAPNQRVNLHTIVEMASLLANTTANLSARIDIGEEPEE